MTIKVSPEDQERILTPEDYQVVYKGALCPEVTEGDIVAVLATIFQGHVEGQARVLYSNPMVGIAFHAKSEYEQV